MKPKFFFLFFISFLCFDKVFAERIPAIPLRELISVSKHIVYVNVIDIQEINKKQQHIFDTHRAILVILEQLQGNIKNDTIEVYFSPRISCPSPPYYKKGKTALTFLNFRNETSNYESVGLFYGTKNLEKEFYEVYKSRILEMQQISKLKESDEKNKKMIDWFILCLEDKTTKEEAILDAGFFTYIVSEYDEKNKKIIKKYVLEPHHKQKLRNLFFGTKEIQYHYGFIEALTEEKDPEMLSFIIQEFKENYIYYLDNYDYGRPNYSYIFMTKIIELSNRKELKEILDKINLLKNDNNEEIQKLTKEFIKKL